MDVDSSTKSGPSTMVPIAIGLLGVVFGAIALYMAMSNSSSVTSKINDLSARVDDASTKATAAASGMEDLQNKVKLNADTISSLHNGVQDFITQVSGVLNKQNQEITDLSSKSSKAPTTASRSSKGASGGESSGPGGTYTIVSGDNFSKIASKNGVSVAAIEAANPGVDSTKLKVGQKINLPGAHSASSAPTPVTPAPEAATAAASTP